MTHGVAINEHPDGWTIRFDEDLVTQLQVDYRLGLLLDGGALIVLDEPFGLRIAEQTVRVPPGEAVYEVADALPLFNQRVRAVDVRRSGELTVTFDSGAVIDVPVNRAYENWHLVMPDGEFWVGLPGVE